MLKKNVDENSCNDASAVPNSSILEIAKFISTHRGSEALNEIAAFAALHFDVQYVHIALLQSDRHSVEVVAGYLEGKAVEPGYTYDLFGTPCQNVIEHDHRCYAQHVQQLFPEDEDLMQLHAEGYIGEPINAGDGSVIGLIVLVSQKPLQSSSLIAASMRILASYVSNIMIANEVRRERERYKHLMRYAFDGIILHDMNHNIIDYNYKAKVMLGYSDDEMLRLNVVDFDVNYSEQKIASLVEAVKQEAITFQTRHRRKDGTLYDAAVTAVLTALDGDDYFYTTIRDVSEQNHMQQRLQESQLLLKTVINEMPDVLAVKDENANFVLVNETLANLYETTPEMMPGKDDGYFGVPDEMNNFFRQNVLGIMDKGEPEIVFEDSRDAKTGEIRHFRSIKKPFKTTEGKQRILILAQDITELIETQNSLEKSLEQLQSMLQTTRDAYWLLDATGKILDVNEAMCDMMGYSHQELLQMSVTQIEANENSSQAQRHMEKIIQDGSDRFESIHRRKDSTLIDVDASVTYISSQRLFIAFIRDISEQKQFERDLSQQRGFLKTLVQTIPDLVWLKDPDGLYLACNPRFESFFGAKEEEIIGKSDYDFVDKELADFFRMHDKNVMTNKMPSVNEETISFASDGHKELLQTSKTPMYDGNGNLIGVLGVGHDISALRAYEETIRQSEESFRSLFDSLQEAVYVQDEQGVFLAVNKGAQRMYGYPVEWFVGKTPLDISAPGMNDLEALMPAHQSAMAGEPQSFEFWALRSDGTPFLKEVHQSKGVWLGKEVVFAVALDITERKKHEEQLQHIAHYDALTSLPNRLLLLDRLHQAILRAKRHDVELAIAYLDLDGFKNINDLYGHDVGDQLLIYISNRLKEVLREEDTLARLGGDEFVAVLIDLEGAQAGKAVVERMLQAASEPVVIDGHTLQVSASIGVSNFSKEEQVDADQLIRQSDQAMYLAKQSGKNRYCYFDLEHDRNIRGHHESLQRISDALEKEEFVLYYQPKVNLRTGEVIGAEALIRWQHPDQGLLAPISFLPVIKNNPLAIAVGDWVLETALAQMQTWKTLGLEMPVSVNVDALQLQQDDFVPKIKALLKRYSEIAAGDLELEVLETSALEDIVHVSQQIKECMELGVHFALDDFGTGYSSLTYLKRLPAQTLKIDKSFVIDMLDDPEDLAILDGVLGLADVFRRDAIAEGVESLQHGVALLRMGCELAQGYAIAKPMNSNDFQKWIAAWKPDEHLSEVRVLKREEMRMLYVIAEHRAWVKQLSMYVNARQTDLPILDLNACEFGKWLQHQENSEFCALTHQMKDVHREIHEKAAEMIAKLHVKSTEHTLQTMREIDALKDTLVELLSASMDK